jgi:hypothetical protein
MSGMKVTPVKLVFRVTVDPGEKFALPEAVLDAVKEGQWLLTIERSPIDSLSDSFLRGYAPEDEGLYDDLVEQASN